MKFAHFSHVWGKSGMTPVQRYEQEWRELKLCDTLGEENRRLVRRVVADRGVLGRRGRPHAEALSEGKS